MTREEIEKKAYEVYPEIREEHTERDINDPYRKAYIKGLTEQLDCPKIKGWVARDKSGIIRVGEYKPERGDYEPARGKWCAYGECLTLPKESFPNLKWEDDPIEVELIVKKI